MDIACEEEVLRQQEGAEQGTKGPGIQEASLFDKLESKLESTMDGRVKETSKGIELNLGLNDKTTELAQTYLESLDGELARVEEAASAYWSKLSNGRMGLWSSFSKSWGIGETADGTAQKKPEATVNNDHRTTSDASNFTGTRTDLELKRLSQDKSLYSNAMKTLDLSEVTPANKAEVDKILSIDKQLAQLADELVPSQISYDAFWQIYFDEKSKIIQMGEERKRLSNEAKRITEEEEVKWDDDEDEDADEKEQDGDESLVIVDKKDTEKEASQPALSSKEKNEDNKREDASNNDDDDDDWE
ncbi:Dos2p KNAG_0D01940 [Huiozyma naganishii CBS 8797]|uniref:BSD domain-containing protein n=1 Tax=Huiozyma naganishii (strain ATCC MYA-139 / BCRC 22969 / CBS 8797 / KCTC 17520 / NBRC 10181 / NCYC 3082 / Yp74L-3) TaxID=1071383 RepID=J7R529_HUIN7|nr:hypothetical protein KNAG_0D01940 [Kazachstania naganishii CBS 8797]CCK69945.1 hypothetical protein KNAG_0D01940 [Kazachstania naganishii CBS 8797]